MDIDQKTNKKLLSIIIVMSLTIFVVGLIMIITSLSRTNNVPNQEKVYDDGLPTMPDDLDPVVRKPVTTKKVISEEECIDAWIEKSGLNEYGDPMVTNYLGGPLYNETTGETISRLDYIYSNHPDLRETCN